MNFQDGRFPHTKTRGSRSRRYIKCAHKRWKLVERPEVSFHSGTHGRHYDSICTNCKGMA